MLEKIQEVLNREVSQDDTAGLEAKLLDCVNLLGASSKLKAEAHRALFKARDKIIRNNPDAKTAHLKLIVDAQTADEQAEFMLAERLNVSLSKAIDGLKAILNISSEEEVKW